MVTDFCAVRLFRQLTAAHLFVESIGPNGPSFTLTSLGRPYLHPDHRAFNNFMFFDLIPSIMAMPKTLAEKRYKAPTKLIGTPFQWANGEELWTWLGSHPDRALNMVAAMTSHNPLDAYPWGIELAKLDLKDEDIAIVDIAGGQGHISKWNSHVISGCPTRACRSILNDQCNRGRYTQLRPYKTQMLT